MRVLVTGADGQVGRALVERLLRLPPSHALAPRQLLLVDRSFASSPDDPRVRRHAGDIVDPRLLRRVLADGVQCVFHLAWVAHDEAERDPMLGQRVNLGATLELLNQMHEQPRRPIVVFPSSLEVYGLPPPERIDEATPTNPQCSGATQQVIAELLLGDFSRRLGIDGRVVRLPALVASPRSGAPRPARGLAGCMHDLLAAMALGESRVIATAAETAGGWMSLACGVDNLLHAAMLALPPGAVNRTWVPTLLRLSFAEVLDGLARRLGEDRRAFVTFTPAAPSPSSSHAAHATFPALSTPRACAAGFRHDGSVDGLIEALGIR
jgi:nucleoside-diphosphate-sugar epimerase